MIELKEVSCSFSDGFGGKGLFTAVSPLSAHFSDGGRYAIVGESGSGKTTLALTARAFCHEIEHLDGHLFVEHTDHLMTEEELEEYMNQQEEDEE